MEIQIEAAREKLLADHRCSTHKTSVHQWGEGGGSVGDRARLGSQDGEGAILFNRLQQDVKLAYILLCEASIYRCAVPEDWWISHLEDWTEHEEEQQTALDTLRERYLVEEVIESDRYRIRQHNLIRSVSLDHLQRLDETNVG